MAMPCPTRNAAEATRSGRACRRVVALISEVETEAKYCALVVIDEVMSALMGYDFYFWHEVKTELDKL